MVNGQQPAKSMGPSGGGPGLRWFFFGFSGRISRLPYLLGFLFPVFFAAGIVRRLDMLPEDSGEFLFWGFVLVFLAPLWLWSYLAMGVKRLHDINIPGPVVICLFVPAVSLIAMLVLFLWPGTAGANDHGENTNRPKRS